MIDPLTWLWPVVELPRPVVSAHTVFSWPPEVFRCLTDLGLLVRCEDAARILCPECQDHYEEVLVASGPDRSTRHVIACPEHLRVVVPPETCRQWTMSLDSLAARMAETLALSGTVSEYSPQRAWRLGRMIWHGTVRELMFVRGLAWADAPELWATLARVRRLIVLVSRPIPEEATPRSLPVVALCHAASISVNCLAIEPLEIAAAIEDADARTQEAGESPRSGQDLKRLIRQQVKAENKSELSDAAFVEAYRQTGSVREAADFLTQQTGARVSKDKIQRAVQRAGGAASVLNGENSNSVLRSDAAQDRDRKGRRVSQAKPDDNA